MSEQLFWIGLGFLVFTLGAWLVKLIDQAMLRGEVEFHMRHEGAQNALCARALLAIRGHRLDKRTRDALTVWLAGQDGGQ